MIMQIRVDIKLEVKDFDPKVKMSLNDVEFYNGVAKEHITHTGMAQWGLKKFENRLIVERYGKDYRRDQTADKDQAVIIKDIKINGLRFPFITTHGIFETETGERFKTNYLGHNGKYVFVFGYPVETWIANHMYKDTNM